MVVKGGHVRGRTKEERDPKPPPKRSAACTGAWRNILGGHFVEGYWGESHRRKPDPCVPF